jgi:hypothetical protein
MNHEQSAIHVQHAFYTPTTLSLGVKRDRRDSLQARVAKQPTLVRALRVKPNAADAGTPRQLEELDAEALLVSEAKEMVDLTVVSRFCYSLLVRLGGQSRG